MSLEILTILNAKSIAFEPSSGGGKPSITQSDVAGALAALDRFKAQILRLKYAGQDEMLPYVVHSLAKQINRTALSEGWKFYEKEGKKSTLVALAECIVDEWLMSKCRTCKGRGDVMVNSKSVVCKSCGGLGERPKTATGRAKACDMEAKNFAENWNDRYENILAWLKGEESQAASDFARAMRG